MSNPSSRSAVLEAAQVYRAGDLDAAETRCRAILSRHREDVDALQLLGTISLRRGRDEEAARCYRQCLRLRPDEAHFHYLMGKLDAVQGRFERAVGRYDRALELTPGYPLAVGWRAYALERLGRTDEALASLEPIVVAGHDDPVMADVYASLLQGRGRVDDAVAILQRHLSDETLSDQDRKNLLFRLGQLCDRAGRYDDAFAAFARANTLLVRPFDRDEFGSRVDELMAVFSRERLAALPRPRTASSKPIFIAGLPRSGTTLVEQIIDAHPQAHGAGEITDFDRFEHDLPAIVGADAYPACVADLTQRVVDRLSKGYLAVLNRRGGRSRRVVNKSLQNYRLLGLVEVLCPGAKVIHCRRDPRDTCLSCFFSHLLPETNPFVSDLGDLGFVYRQYERLMSHWSETLRTPIHEVEYAALVDRPEEVIRGIIDACGLPWDDACLRFHDSGRPVTTLSYDQVRRPMYRTSLDRWRNYEKHLGPLQATLVE